MLLEYTNRKKQKHYVKVTLKFNFCRVVTLSHKFCHSILPIQQLP